MAELGRRATRDRRVALVARERAVVTHAQHHLERAGLRLTSSEAVVRALDPRRVLERGYSITRDEHGRVLRSAEAVAAGTLVDTELADGRVTSRVESTTPRRGHHAGEHQLTDEIGYADAMRELDDILEELERDDLDVDILATRVQRASELIRLCRGRIARAQADVDRVVTDLESLEQES